MCSELTLHMAESLPSSPLPLQVNSTWYSGDVAGARRASTQATQFSIAGIVCGSIILGFAFVLLIVYIIVIVVLVSTDSPPHIRVNSTWYSDS